MNLKLVILFFFCCLFFNCNDKNINIVKPEEIEGFLYKNTFELPQILDSGTYNTQKKTHKNSLFFNSKDSSYTCFKQEIKPSKNFTIALWLTPEFFGRNGTIFTLSKNQKDFPIKSPLSIYMNKNRIAVMQAGKDLRKKNYKNQDDFTSYFMGLTELNVGETYFLTYLYKNGEVTILIDGSLYAEFKNVPALSEISYITLGASWNKKGSKYYFNGTMDDLYIYNKVLNQDEINSLMDFTHVYQYVN